MKKVLKLAFLFLVFIVFILSTYLFIRFIDRFFFWLDTYNSILETYGNDFPKINTYITNKNTCLLLSLYSLLIFVICAIFIVIQMVNIYKNSNFLNFYKYTYEEYKEKRDKQKLQKQAEDKQKK